MSRPSSVFPSSAPTPAPSSPPPSESFVSDIDGTAPSLVETSAGFGWDAGRVDSKALNLVSWKLDVNARAEDGVEKRGFNAISTVLNHPTKKANPLRSSKKPLPPLAHPPPTLPKPPPATHYDSYLQAITPLYESFISAQRSSSLNEGDSLGSEEEQAKARSSLPPLQDVPELFFDPAFDLASPSTWSAVVGEPMADPSNTSGQDTQDTLSTHLDTLERHLLHEITLRSSAFFSALSNLQDLHSESASCLSRITDLQSSLREVGQNQAQKGLDIIDTHERLKVLRYTERGMKTMAELEELVKMAKGLVEAGDWAGGLGYLMDIDKWWRLHRSSATEATDADEIPSSHSTLPFATLPALSNLPDTVSDLTNTIALQLESALNSHILSVLSAGDRGETLAESDFRISVHPILSGLVRCGQIRRIEEVWREVTTTSIREGSRKHLPVSAAEEEGDEEGRPPEARGASLADSLRAMDHSQFLLLSSDMFSTMLARLHRAQRMGEVLAEVVADVATLSPISLSDQTSELVISTNNSPLPSLDLNDVLASACELANNRASKILGVRNEQHSALTLVEFVEIFKENWDFVLATETLAKRMIVSLRGVTASQARAFLVTYHSVRLTKSANLVQEEQWSQVDVLPSSQHVVNLLVEAAVSDPPECAIPASEPHANGDSASPAAKQLLVEDKGFFVVNATAESLVLLGDYLKIVINLELVVTDVMSRIIEFLKSFNSRTCQVVLGAGAMRSAGLKNITAKHLALASQSLSVIVALIPYIREFIRRHLSSKQAVMLTEFDKLKRDYQEHQNEIHAKLVAIMSDRLAVHVGSLREVDWESTPNKDGPRNYAEMLVKETATLHKVLSKYLASQTVEGVLSEVLAAIVHRLGEEYAKIELKSDDGKKRMLQDVALINTKLAPLSEAGTSVASLETLVKDKPTPRRPIGQAMKGMLKRVNSGSVPRPELDENGSENITESEPKKSEDDEGVLAVSEEPSNVNGVNPGTPSRVANGLESRQIADTPIQIKIDPGEDLKLEDVQAQASAVPTPPSPLDESTRPDLPAKDPVDGLDSKSAPEVPEKEAVENHEEVASVPEEKS